MFTVLQHPSCLRLGQPHKITAALAALVRACRTLSQKCWESGRAPSKDRSKHKCLSVIQGGQAQHASTAGAPKNKDPQETKPQRKLSMTVKVWAAQLNSINRINTTTLLGERISLLSQENFFIPPKNTETLWSHPKHEFSHIVSSHLRIKTPPLDSTQETGLPGTHGTPSKYPCG